MTRALESPETAPALPGDPPSGDGSDRVVLPPSLSIGAFRTDDHRYYFNGAGPYPSVTTVLEVMSKPAVVQWKAMETARALMHAPTEQFGGMTEEQIINWAVKESDKARDEAGKIGSSVHLLADMLGLQSGMPPGASVIDSKGFQVESRVIPYLDAFRGFLDRYNASSIVSSEKMVLSANGYAGTYDLLMLLPRNLDEDVVDWLETDKELWLLDIKTSKGYYPEYGLQLAAYRWADQIILPNDPGVYPMPLIQRTGVLHLRPDLYSDTGWRLIEYSTDYMKDYLTFLGALEIWKWRSEGRFTRSNLQKPSIQEP